MRVTLALTFPIAIDAKTPFDTNAPVLTQLRKMSHQMRVCEATIRSHRLRVTKSVFHGRSPHSLDMKKSHTLLSSFMSLPLLASQFAVMRGALDRDQLRIRHRRQCGRRPHTHANV